MLINQYLDSTYLKTPTHAAISEEETLTIVKNLIEEAIQYNFKLVMIRPRYVQLAKQMVQDQKSNLKVGTVIGFHQGIISLEEKLNEATIAITNGADELDFVINYTAFKNGETTAIKEEIIKGTALCLKHGKIVKWIIEIAALSNEEIEQITQLIKNTVLENFGLEKAGNVFVKSSTGFFKTENNKPNGATFEGMTLILNNASPLKVKAAGGIKNYHDAVKMIKLGVLRIGTSSAKKLVNKDQLNNTY